MQIITDITDNMNNTDYPWIVRITQITWIKQIISVLSINIYTHFNIYIYKFNNLLLFIKKILYLFISLISIISDGKILPITLWFFFKNKSFSNNFGFNCVRFAVIVLPAWENNLSLEVDVAEIDKYFLAK